MSLRKVKLATQKGTVIGTFNIVRSGKLERNSMIVPYTHLSFYEPMNVKPLL